MNLPFVARSAFEAIQLHVAFLEDELKRVNGRNEELVNALTATNRAVVPFRDRIPPREVVQVRPRLDADRLASKLERERASTVKFPFPNTPEFDKLREKQESGAAS